MSAIFRTTPAQPARAATLMVTNTNNSGAGSLRQKVLDAVAGDTIIFSPAVAGGTISLTSEIALNKNLTLDGSGLDNQVQVIASGSARLFSIGSGTTVTINQRYMGNSSASNGGAIYVDGDLTVSNSTFAGSTSSANGGALYNAGSLTIANSNLSGNDATNVGGAINNSGTLTVMGSTLSGNTTSFLNGGGIHNFETMTIRNSTLTGNSATQEGGAIYTVASSNTTISNSTFCGNSAPGGGGGIKNSGTLHLLNSILADSTSGGDCLFSGGTFATNSNNLIEDGSCSPALTGNPQLGTLTDNGGPTQTMALLPGSPAIDAGDNPTCESTDQRGWSRPIDGDLNGTSTCDIGAYEKTIDLFLPLIMR